MTKLDVVAPKAWRGAGLTLRQGVVWPRLLVLLAAAGTLVVEHGFQTPPFSVAAGRLVQLGCVGLFLLETQLGIWLTGRQAFGRSGAEWFDSTLAALGALFLMLGPLLGPENGWRLFHIVIMVLLLVQGWRLYVALAQALRRPGVLLPLSFLSLILAGTLLLKLPRCLPPGQSLSWLDALFTITSAVCVTGLIVKDTATQFTPFGQMVIGLFIQLGGLGVLVFGSTVALLLGSRLTLRANLTLGEMLNDQPVSQVAAVAKFTVISTLVIEALGAAALYGLWPEGMSHYQRLGFSVFHSVSAYCNAGFALQTTNLESYRYGAISHLVIAPLIVLGGLGFPVLHNLWVVGGWQVRGWLARRLVGRWRWARGLAQPHWRSPEAELPEHGLARNRLTLHTKLSLVTTAILYLVGVVAITLSQLTPYVTESAGLNVTANRVDPGSLTWRTVGGAMADASFMSIASRTAGFNTIPMDQLLPGSRFIMTVLMLVGGSPGGTAGGVRTTTLAVLVLSVLATLRQREDTEAFGRRISDSLVRKAGTITACFLVAAGLVILALTLIEPHSFGQLYFEGISAVTVTGLSLGITASLTSFGKWVIIVAMFLGRVGPLALLGALVFHGRPARPYRYPLENVMIG